MKKKYTLTVANSEINIITEESKETIDTIVGIVDRKIREVYLHSKGECSRTNAAILVCLDYCAERIELQKAIKNANAQIDRLTLLNETAEKEKAALEREIETLRASLNAAHKNPPKKIADEQIAFDDMVDEKNPEEPKLNTEVFDLFVDGNSDAKTNLDEILSGGVEEKAKKDKPLVKVKKKKVRAMFDNISFDDI